MPIYENKSETAIICFSNGKGGMELDSIKLAKLLCKKLPIVLICKESSFLHAKCLDEKNTFHVETIDFYSKVFSLSIIFNLRKLLAKRNITNVIFFGASELKSMYFSFLGKDINVVVRHGTTKSSKKKGLIHRLIYTCVNHHVSISKHINKNVSEIFPIYSGVNIITIYPSFPVYEKKGERLNRDIFEIIHVGRIASGKGQIDAVKACLSLHNKKIKFRLRIIGDVDDIKYFEKLNNVIDNCVYKNNVEIIPAVRNIREIYESADILLFPSYGEGLGNVFLEAIASSLICITYDNTTFPEFKNMGLYFHMVQTSNIKLLSSKLLNTVSDFDSELDHIEHNLVKIKSNFSEENEYAAWTEILKD